MKFQILFIYDDKDIYFLPFESLIYYYKPKEEVVVLLNEKGEKNKKLKCMLERNKYTIDFPEFSDKTRSIHLSSYETYKKYNSKKNLKDYNTYIWEVKLKLMSIQKTTTLKCINLKSDLSKKQKWNDYIKDYYYQHIEQKKQYYQDKKEILNEKIECLCGKTYTKQHQKRHSQSKYHQTHC